MPDEHLDKEDETGGDDDERMVPLNVVESIRTDEQAKRVALEAQIEELEAAKEALSRADADDGIGDYDPDDLAVIERIMESKLGPLANVLETLVEQSQSTALHSKVSAIEGLPEEYQSAALQERIEQYRAEAQKAGRFITSQEAFGALLVEDLPSVVEAISKSSEESRKAALDKKRAAAMAHAGGGFPEGVPTELEKDWHKGLPKGADPTEAALDRVLQRTGVELPGPS